MRIVCWFSCGNNSAVASKLALDKFYAGHEVVVARCVVDNEHPDNDRFCDDVERWYGVPILRLRSTEYKDCWEVWERRRYISGIKGAPCTIELKKAVRWAFEREWKPDAQVFGYSLEENHRAALFKMNNPDVTLMTPLIHEGLTKPDCAMLIQAVGVTQNAMYALGFKNANCICCAKATSIVYWAMNRHYFPEQFWRMSELSRRLGCRLTRLKGVRIFLDEIPEDFDWRGKKDRSRAVECGIGCQTDLSKSALVA